MKNLRLISFALPGIILGIALCFTGCKKSGEKPSDMTGEYKISGEVQDPVTSQPIAGITIKLLDKDGEELAEIISDNNGNYTINNLAKGEYSMKSVSNGAYNEMTVPAISVGSLTKSSNVQVGNYVAFLPVPEYITIQAGAISGLVMDKDGNPVANANVSISAEADSLTNGYFATTKTNSLGQFKIGVIPIFSPVSYLPIPSFKIKTVKDGFVNLTKGVIIHENQMIVVNCDLVNQPDLGNVVYSEGFEGSGWTFTGFWHRQANATIINRAFVDGFVQLPPADKSGGAIPPVYQGNHMAWYGDSITGNFLGEHDPEQGPGTGGTGYNPNSGTLTSGPISLTGLQQAALYFQNWFEIESVNPNQEGFDIMEVVIINAADSNMKTSLARMNPYSDPVLQNRDAIAYTSGGFNAVPTWNLAQFDLTPFVGQTILIRFEFSTIDALYNGFRGWFIDDITIRDKAPASRSSEMKPYNPPKPRPR